MSEETEPSQRGGEVLRPRRRAFLFTDEVGMLRGLGVLDRMEKEEPVSYDTPNSTSVIVRGSLAEIFERKLQEEGISYREIGVVPISQLSLERQAQLRGLLPRS